MKCCTRGMKVEKHCSTEVGVIKWGKTTVQGSGGCSVHFPPILKLFKLRAKEEFPVGTLLKGKSGDGKT